MPVSEQTSITMSRIPARNTKPELMMRKALRQSGLGGYRLHWKKVPGRPDIAYPGKRLAVFVHGCYWHRCPTCQPPFPKSHTEFWKEKFEKNVARDQKKIDELRELGWVTCVVWECELKKDVEHCVERVREAMARSTAKKLSGS